MDVTMTLDAFGNAVQSARIEGIAVGSGATERADYRAGYAAGLRAAAAVCDEQVDKLGLPQTYGVGNAKLYARNALRWCEAMIAALPLPDAQRQE